MQNVRMLYYGIHAGHKHQAQNMAE